MTAVSRASSLSAIDENATPILPTALELTCAHFKMWSMRVTVVVFPFVPVTAICSPTQKDDASSISLTTVFPSSRASKT